MLVGTQLWGKNCFSDKIQQDYNRLFKYATADELSPALRLADSLLTQVKEQGLEDCPTALKIRFQKAEVLEMEKDRTEEALDIYYDLVRDARRLKQWDILGETYVSISRTHEILKRPQDARRYLDFASELIEEHQLNKLREEFNTRSSSFHRMFGSLDTAKIYARKAIHFGRFYNNKSSIGGNMMMGILSEDSDSSIFYFQETVKGFLEEDGYQGAIYQKLNIVRQYLSKGDFAKAEENLADAESFMGFMEEGGIGYYSAQESFFETKSKLFRVQGMTDSAYIYLTKSLDAKNRAYSQANQEAINQKETAFAIERERAKLELEKERAVSLRRWLMLTGAFLVSLCFVAFLLERSRRHVKKQNNLIALQNEKLNKSNRYQTVLLEEINHRVKNNLQLVMSILALKGLKQENEETKNLLEEISNKVYSIALIHEKLYQTSDFDVILVKDYMTELLNYYAGIQKANFPFQYQFNCDDIELNLETVLPLGIICSELVSNSLKYARIPEKPLILDISIKQQDEKYSFRYQDNGPGYPDNPVKKSSKGIGELLIQSMVRQLNAESRKFDDNGAGFELKFIEKQTAKL